MKYFVMEGGVTMDKPKNSYKPGTAIYRLMDEDWSTMTRYEIADVLHVKSYTVANQLSRIKYETGYCVPHFDGRKNMWKNGHRIKPSIDKR